MTHFDVAVFFLGINPINLKPPCSSGPLETLIAAPFVNAKGMKCVLVMGKQPNKLWSTYAREPYIAIKKDELELYQLLWKGLYKILREKSKTQKYLLLSHFYKMINDKILSLYFFSVFVFILKYYYKNR